MERSVILLVSVASVVLFSDTGFAQDETFDLKFDAPGGTQVSGAPGATVEVEINLILGTSDAGVAGMSYSMGASSPDGVEFELLEGLPLPCPLTCLEENLTGVFFFFSGSVNDPDKSPSGFPGNLLSCADFETGGCPQGQGYTSAISYFVPFLPGETRPAFQLPAGPAHIVGKIKLLITVPSNEAGGTVDLAYKDGFQGPGEPVPNGVTFMNGTRDASLGSLTINVTPTKASSIPFDADGSNVLDVMDALVFLDHYFRGDPAALPCGDGTVLDSANIAFFDSNGDGELDLSDAVHIMRHVFLSGEPHSTGEDCQQLGGCPDFCGA